MSRQRPRLRVVTNFLGTASNTSPVLLFEDPTPVPGTLVSLDGMEVPKAAQGGVVGLAVAVNQALALRVDGSVVAWEWDGTNMPASARSVVVSIAAGPYHSLVLKQDGSLEV